jgi:hypothetical protein
MQRGDRGRACPPRQARPARRDHVEFGYFALFEGAADPAPFHKLFFIGRRIAGNLPRPEPNSASERPRKGYWLWLFAHVRFPGRWSMGRKAAISPGLRSILSTSLA